MTTEKLTEIIDPNWHRGSRTIIKGDLVQVSNSAPRKKDSFVGYFVSAIADDEGNLISIDVYGGPRGFEKQRTLSPDRVKFKARPDGPRTEMAAPKRKRRR